MATATVKLTAYNMGSEATEQDFDNWVGFVNERIDAKAGMSVEVDSFPFAAGPASDEIAPSAHWSSEQHDEQIACVRDALETLWDDWGAEGAPGPATVHPLRAAVEAAEAELTAAQGALEALENDSTSVEDHDAAATRVDHADVSLENAKAALKHSDCPRQWQLTEEGYGYQVVIAVSTEEALELARDGVDRSNYSEATGTIYIDVRVDCEETGESDSDTVTLEPDMPDCADGEEHDWCSPIELVGGCKENPGVHGNGGGVIITEVCRHCGCKKTTDTWAHNPSTGEQGLHSVSYEEDTYTADELAAAFGSDEA